MSTLIRHAALALGLLSVGACGDEEPRRQSNTDNATAQAGLDASVAIVHESGGRSRDAASPVRSDGSAAGSSSDAARESV
jgi:hypothetical protein